MKLTMIFSFLLASLFSCQPKQQREAYTSLAVDEFAALLARPDVQRVDVRTVASNLGHSQTSTTLDIYAHAFDKQRRESQKTLEDVLGI